MRRIVIVVVALLATAVCLDETARAQVPQFTTGPQTGSGGPTLKRSSRPVVSASAGLLGTGVGANSSFGYQYFTRVQPQQNTQRSLRSLGRSVSQLQATPQGSLPLSSQAQYPQGNGLDIGPTGHPTGYMSHLSYFGTNLGKNGSSAGASRGSPPGQIPATVNNASSPSSLRR